MSDNQDMSNDDDFYDEDDLPALNKWKMAGMALAVVVVAGFGVGIWYAYDQGVKKGVQLAPPIIKADSSIVKKAPEDEGGMDIPHQDKKIFSVLTGDKEDEKVEKLMEAPEEATREAAPIDITETVPAKPSTKEAETLMAKPSQPTINDTSKTVAEAVEKPAEVAKTVEAAAKKAVAVPEKSVAMAKPVALPAKPVAASKKSDGDKFRVQLGAFRSMDAAEKAWVDLQKAHKSLLGDVPHVVQSIEIKGKGLFHRLQAGAYGEKVAANTLCQNLKAEKQDCLVAKN